MAIGENTTNKARIEKKYQEIYNLHNKIKKQHNNIKELSIGMTGDYKIALKNGATIIRIGTALFGKRNG